jgi:zinc transporter 1
MRKLRLLFPARRLITADVSHGHSHSHEHKEKQKQKHKHKHKEGERMYKHDQQQEAHAEPEEEEKAEQPAAEGSPAIANGSSSDDVITLRPQSEAAPEPRAESVHSEAAAQEEENGYLHSHKSKMGMYGVFLHILGDALGSVVVLVVGFVLWKWSDWKYGKYLDPLLSVVVVCILLVTTFPLGTPASFSYYRERVCGWV